VIQRKNSGVHPCYYEDKGLTDDEISFILKEINKKKSNHRRNRKYLRESGIENWEEIYLESQKRHRDTMESLGRWIVRSEYDSFGKYRSLVSFYTRQSLEKKDLLNLNSKELHIDHRFSVKSGFLNQVSPEVIGSIVDLCFLPAKLNSAKEAKSSITPEELNELYKNEN